MIKEWVEQFNKDTACEGSVHDLDLFFGNLDRSLWITKLFEVGHYINELANAESYNLYVVGIIPLNDLGNRSKPPKTLNNRINNTQVSPPDIYLGRVSYTDGSLYVKELSNKYGVPIYYAKKKDDDGIYYRYLELVFRSI